MKFISKIISFSILLIMGITIFPLISFAEITDSGGSTLGECKTYTGTTDYLNRFFLNLSDNSNGVEKFLLEENYTSGIKKPVTHPDYYKITGIPLKLNFKYYDVLDDQTYEIGLPSPSSLPYGTTTVQEVKIIAGSSLTLAEEDDGVFSGGDDVFTLNLQTKENKAVMWIKREGTEYPLPEKDCDLEFDLETLKKHIAGQLKFSIQLADGKTVQAKITFDKGNINFSSGLSANSSEASQAEATTDPKEEKKRERPIGFTGTNLEIMERSAYKGISNENNLETTLTGFVNWILGFAASIAVLIFIYGGYLWLTDQGDESNIEKAKSIIAGALIGILIIISAYTIVNTVLDFSDAYPEGCEFGINLETGETPGVNLDCEIDLDTPSLGIGIGGIIGL